MLLKKRQTNGPVDQSSKFLPDYHSAHSKRTNKPNNLSLDLDYERSNIIAKSKLSNIKEEDKECSYNILTLNDIEQAKVPSARSNSSPK